MEDASNEDLAWSLMDIMAATMFVFVILLVLYVYLFRANYETAPAIGPHTSDVVALRTTVLDMLSDALDRRGLAHQVNSRRAEISITASSLAFPSGQFEMDAKGKKHAARLADALAEVLSCFAAESGRPQLRCPENANGSLEGLVIIGHTDNVPLRPSSIVISNLDLSVRRAAHLVALLEENDGLSKLKNSDGNLLLVAMGAGSRRPVQQHPHFVADPRNRRISIRAIMDAPWITY